jgi:hypothetical protein
LDSHCLGISICRALAFGTRRSVGARHGARLSKLAVYAGSESGLRRPLCGKASPFRTTPRLIISSPQAGRLSLPACSGKVEVHPESRRLSASRGGSAAGSDVGC